MVLDKLKNGRIPIHIFTCIKTNSLRMFVIVKSLNNCFSFIYIHVSCLLLSYIFIFYRDALFHRKTFLYSVFFRKPKNTCISKLSSGKVDT